MEGRTWLLAPATYDPYAPARKEQPRNTIIEDVPQVSARRAKPADLPIRLSVTSPMSEDFPTPKANVMYRPILDDAVSPSSSDTASERSSLWSKRSSQSEFDEMYDLTESESEEVPIKLSGSVKKLVDSRSKYPSLVIPSPSAWPTIQKLQSASALSPPMKITLSPSMLSQLNTQQLQVPSTSSTPSLDGSMTSEELASISSCPSTPDLQHHAEDEHEWEPTVQLDPYAISLLQHLHTEVEYEQLETVIEVPEEAMQEMREIVESPGLKMRLNTKNLTDADDSTDQLSALSIPSPGGLFSSLNSSLARHIWAGTEPTPTTSTATEFYSVPFCQGLPTSTAHAFYNVPWDVRPENPVEHSVSVAPAPNEQDPVTARKVVFSPTKTITEVAEIDEQYENVLQETASVNIDRTQLWLNAQKSYLNAISEDDDVVKSFQDVDGAVPCTPQAAVSPSINAGSPSKKSVRFADSPIELSPKSDQRISPIHDGTFWQAHQHTQRSMRARDAFAHRQARAEAVHVERTSSSKEHVAQLQGKYEITTASRPAPARPISTMLPTTTDDERKAVIAQAERERQALEQIQPSAWNIAALKELQGGSLLTTGASEMLREATEGRVLDLAGQVHGSWSWDVAYRFPSATVTTTVPSDAEAHVAASAIDGPENQNVTACPKLWQMPFPDFHFDIISARNLYAYLKTTVPKSEIDDEWDLTLAECMRVLKPGGYLEFNLVDAELVHPGSAGQALSVEFAFNLKTRGYDAAASRSFLPRLRKAGFEDVKRAWLVLPMGDVNAKWVDSGKTPSSTSTITPNACREDCFGDRVIGPNGSVTEFEPPLTGSTCDVKAMTGLVGARMWEQWMVKLGYEMGKSEERCLEGVSRALAEGGKGSSGWRCLVGWARKGF